MTDEPRPTRGIILGRIAGARLIVQPSTLLMLVVLALLFSSSDQGGITRHAFSLGMLLAVLLFVSVFLHELAHAIAAWAFGRQVREIVITLWGGHTSFDAKNITPAVSGITAIAGPVANGVLALSGWALLSADVFQGTARGVLTWIIYANVLLAAFNALPGIPMDGGRVLESIVWHASGDRNRATFVAAWAGRVIAVAVVIFALGAPYLRGSRPDLVTAVWAFLIFMILWPAATAAIKMSSTMARREATTAASLMIAAVSVPFTVTVADARTIALRANAAEVVVMAGDGQPAGHFPTLLTDSVPEADRGATGLQSVTMPLARGAIVSPELDGSELVEALRSWWGRTDVWVVVDGERIVGVLPLEAALKALQ